MQNLIFTNDVLAAVDRLVSQGDHNVIVWIADVNTARLINPAPPCLITIPDGDENKTLETVTRVWDEMERLGVTRRSLVINLGGGMVTDLPRSGARCSSRENAARTNKKRGCEVRGGLAPRCFTVPFCACVLRRV